jgi:hypothetical protein
MKQKLAKLLGGEDKLYPHRLAAQHPHVIGKIVELWGGAALEAYFDNLMLDTRCTRTGFAPEVLAEIFALRNHYQSLRPAPARTPNTWGELTDISDVRIGRGGE